MKKGNKVRKFTTPEQKEQIQIKNKKRVIIISIYSVL